MKNIILNINNWWRYITHEPPQEIKFRTIEYQTSFTNYDEVSEHWNLKRPWGELHPDPNSGENFWISEDQCQITPLGAKIGMVKSCKYDGSDGNRAVDWACGMLWSKLKFGYGYSEVEVELSDNMGQWTAPLWLFEADEEKTREIDVCEFYIDERGMRTNSAMHFYGDRKSHTGKHHRLNDVTWRTVKFGVLREPNRATIYYDGHPVRVEKIDTHKKMSALIGTGMKTIPGAQPGEMRVLSFKHGQIIK